MYIDRNRLYLFTCSKNDRVIQALKKIEQNEHGFVVCLNEDNSIHGVLTDGDLRRYLISNVMKDLENIKTCEIVNKKFSAKKVGQTEGSSISRYKFIPIIDKDDTLIGIDLGNKRGFFIDSHYVGSDTYPFVIGEIGNNHNGSLDLAFQLIDKVAESGAPCVKFQNRDVSKLYTTQGNKDSSADLATQYTKALLYKYNLKFDQLVKLFDYSKSVGLIPMCTPWDENSAKQLIEYGMPAYKVASADLTNLRLLEILINTNAPLLLSTGMSYEKEIIETVHFLESRNAQFALLHCNSTYPAPFDKVNLGYIRKLKDLFDCPIGYSGHERDIHVSGGAVALGASLIERHITLDRNMEGSDHKASLLPVEFTRLVTSCDQIYRALGSSTASREVSQGEMINRHNLSKSIVARVDIKHGEPIKAEKLDVKSPGIGLSPNRFDEIIGTMAQRSIKKGEFFYDTDLEHLSSAVFENKLSQPIGVPVRYHDHDLLTTKQNYDFVEFHFSHADLEYNPKNQFKPEKAKFFSAHAPELFAEDHILDLASTNKDYRRKSVEYLNFTIERTLQIRDLYSSDFKPVVVVNCGGFSESGFLDHEQKLRRYDLLRESLTKIDRSEVRFCAQTMPPFPWHLGGQSFHNLFIWPDETVNFCLENDIYCCLDTSHTLMSANYFGFDFFEGVQKLSQVVQHVHLADARGIDDEGVSLGDGDLDLREFKSFSKTFLIDTPFVCETWQGHLNSGIGFVNDLNRYLEA